MAFAKGFFDRQAGAADLVFTPTTSIPVSNVQDAIQYVWDNVNGGVAGTYAPPDAEYLTSALASGLSNERVVGNGTGITWDFSGAGAAVANLDHLGIEDLTDPNADRVMGWDDSEGKVAWFTPASGLAFVGTNLSITDADLVAIINEASFALGDVLYHNGTTLARLPAGTSGQFLRTRGTAAAPDWQNIAGGGDMLRANNLSDLTDAPAATVNLGLEIGVDVQAYGANLDTWSGLAPSANAQSLVTAANYAAMRGLLDLEVGTDFYSIAAADGAIAAAVANYTLTTDLASTATAKGASLIGIEDSGGLITATTVEAALAENRAAIDTAEGRLDAIEADYLVAADIATALFDADIGVTVQAYAANLTTWAGLAPSANAQSLVTAANYAAMRGLLDLEVGTDFYSIAATDAAIAAYAQPLAANLTEWAGIDPSADGGSLVSAANFAAMRTLLDLEVGTDFLSPAAIAAAYQPLDTELSAIAGLSSADGNFIVGSATGWVVESGSTARTSLGLGTMATETATDYLTTAAAAAGYQPLDADLTTWAGLTPSANAQSLVTAANFAAMRTLLDLEAGTDFLSPAAIAAAYQPLAANLTEWASINPSANGGSLVAAADYAAMRGLLDLEAGTDFYSKTAADAAFQALDADTLKADTADVLTAGFAATPYNAGTKSSGTFTPDEANGNFQYATNGGAHTFAPPTNNGTLIVLYANNASAGAITTSGFTQVTGDSLTTTDGHEFLFYVTKHNNGSAFSHLHVTALQ